MIIFKLIVVWLAIGAMVQVAMILKIWKTAHDHGAKFRFEFDLKCTLADIIAWPRFIIMVNDVLEQVKDTHTKTTGPHNEGLLFYRKAGDGYDLY